jgi:hypothetical protein
MLFKQNSQSGQNGKPTAAMTATEKTAAAKPLMSSPVPPAAPAPARPAATASEMADGGKRLIVGEGIQMKGEITACDRLVVEGQVEVTLKATRMLEIKPTGHFTGSCEVGHQLRRDRARARRPDHRQARGPRPALPGLGRARKRPPERRLAERVAKAVAEAQPRIRPWSRGGAARGVRSETRPSVASGFC